MDTMMGDSMRATRVSTTSFGMQPRNSFRRSDSSVDLPGLKIFQPSQSHNRSRAVLDANALMNMGWTPPGDQRTGFQPENNFPALEWSPPPSQQPPQGSNSPSPGQQPPQGSTPPGSEKAPPTTSASEVDDITKRIQDKFKHGVGEDGEEDDTEEDKETGEGDKDQQRVPRKRPAGATDAKAAKAAKAAKTKGKSGKDNGGKAKQQLASIENVDKCLKLVQANLPYKGKKSKPMHYKQITIYTNKKGFRVKPGYGRRDEKIVSYGSDPRAAFLAAQKHAATYLATAA